MQCTGIHIMPRVIPFRHMGCLIDRDKKRANMHMHTITPHLTRPLAITAIQGH